MKSIDLTAHDVEILLDALDMFSDGLKDCSGDLNDALINEAVDHADAVTLKLRAYAQSMRGNEAKAE